MASNDYGHQIRNMERVGTCLPYACLTAPTSRLILARRGDAAPGAASRRHGPISNETAMVRDGRVRDGTGFGTGTRSTKKIEDTIIVREGRRSQKSFGRIHGLGSRGFAEICNSSRYSTQDNILPSSTGPRPYRPDPIV